MLDLSQIVAELVWVGLIGSWLAYQRSAARARGGSGQGGCARCGVAIERTPVLSATGRSELCSNCFKVTQRNYRAASWLFLGIGAFFVALGPVVFIREYRRFGLCAAAEAVALLAGFTLLAGAPGWFLRRLGRDG
jgi:predicted nucleic acid-binding Zn ribbon protein